MTVVHKATVDGVCDAASDACGAYVLEINYAVCNGV